MAENLCAGCGRPLTDDAPALHGHAPSRTFNVGGLLAIGVVALLVGLALAALLFG